MQEKYIAFIRSDLLKPRNAKTLFFGFLKHFEIKTIKKFSDFELLKNKVLLLQISPQEIFSKVAIFAVKQGWLETLQFLMDTCGYDLKNTVDENGLGLLHEACLRSETAIVEYLLQKGFDPNVSDFQKSTALHSAIQAPNQEKSPEIIALLHQHKANLNIKDAQKLTPLHLAALYKNDRATSALLSFKANDKLKWNDFTHIQLKKQIEWGNISNTSPAINLTLPEKTTVEKAKSEYYKGCFSPKFHISTFQNVRAWLLKKQGSLNNEETCALTNAILLTSSFSPFDVENFVSTLSELIKKNKLDIVDALSAVARVSLFFGFEQQVEIVAQLNQFISNTVADQKTAIHADKLCVIYSTLGYIYKSVALFKESEAAFLQAQSNLKQQTNQEKAEIFFNLGCVQRYLMKQTEAIESFKQAFYLDKNDIESFTVYVNCLLTNKIYDEALKLTKESNFGEYSRLFNLYVNLIAGHLTHADILKSIDTTSSINRDRLISLEVKTECFIKLGQFEEAVTLTNETLSIAEQRFEEDKEFAIEFKIQLILEAYIQASQFKKALALAENLSKKYASNFERSVLTMGTHAVLHIAEGQFDNAKDIIKKIKLIGADPKTLSNLYYYFAVNLLSSETTDINYSMALQYINLALEFDPKHFRGNLYKLLIAILLKQKENAESTLHNLNCELGLGLDLITELQKNSVTEVDSITEEETVSLKIELENYDPIKIHEFWQAEKEHVLKESMENLSSALKPKAIWKVGSTTFQEGLNGLTPIFHPRYPNCYAVIHPNLDLDSTLRKKCESVLANNDLNLKGLSSDGQHEKTQRKANQGVQTLNNSVTQLKILGNCGDKRLWTNKVYRNDNKHLIVFDNCDDHQLIRRKAQKANDMQVIDLQQISNNAPFQSTIFAPADKDKSPTEQTSAKIPAGGPSMAVNL